jgi:hypothetical protein
MEIVFSISDTIAVLHQGSIIATDPSDELRRNDEVRRVYLGTSREPTSRSRSALGQTARTVDDRAGTAQWPNSSARMFDLIRSSCSRWQTVLRTSLLACSEPSTRGVFPDFGFKSAEVLIMTIVDHREQLELVERLKREGLSMLLAAQGLPCSPALPVCLLARGAVRHTGTAARLRDYTGLGNRLLGC